MCRHLWDHDHDDDHFVTQLNPDGSVHDKVRRRSHWWGVTGHSQPGLVEPLQQEAQDAKAHSWLVMTTRVTVTTCKEGS